MKYPNTVKIIGVILLVASALQCKKENKSLIDVSKITFADASGNSSGTTDPTDWTNDPQWSSSESALFRTPTTSELANTTTGTINSLGAFPNPISTQQNIFVNTSTNTLLEIVVTDNMLNIIKEFSINTKPGLNFINFLYEDSSIFANHTNYRIYYAFYSQPDGLFYKGHGDIRIER